MNAAPETRRDGPAEIALLAVCLIWGCNFSVMKVALEELPPLAFNAVRLTCSAVFLGVVHFATGGHRRRLPAGSWPKLLGLALLGYFAYQVFFMAGLDRTSSGNAALLVASAPVFTFLMARWLGERLQRLAWLGMLIAFAGTASLALARGVDLDSRMLAGNLIVLGSAIAWGCFTALNRGLALSIPAGTLAFYCTVVVLPLHWALGAGHLAPLWEGSVSMSTWASVAYSGLLGTGFAVVLFNVGLRGVGASYTAGIISMVPVLALLLGWLALDEPITSAQIVGGVCVLGGVWIIRRSRRDPRPPTASPSPSPTVS